MEYEYEMIPIPKIMSVKYGEDLAESLAEFLANITNKMSNDGWEFYRADNYVMASTPGCFASLFGAKAEMAEYSVACFRRAKRQIAKIDNLNNNDEKPEDKEEYSSFLSKGIYKK